MTLIEIKKNKFDVDIDLRYSKKNNITGKKIFMENKCYLNNVAAEKLSTASKIARNFKYKLKIFDAYRPKYVQEELWRLFPNSEFLTDHIIFREVSRKRGQHQRAAIQNQCQCRA